MVAMFQYHLYLNWFESDHTDNAFHNTLFGLFRIINGIIASIFATSSGWLQSFQCRRLLLPNMKVDHMAYQIF